MSLATANPSVQQSGSTMTVSGAASAIADYPDSSSTAVTYGTTAGFVNYSFTTLSATLPSNSVNISVAVLYYAKKSASQADNFSAQIAVGGTNYVAAAHSPTTTATLYTDTWSTNPKTGAAWQAGEVNGTDPTNPLQFIGFDSTDASPSILVYSAQLQVTYTVPTTSTCTASEAAYLASARTASQAANVSVQPACIASQAANLDWDGARGAASDTFVRANQTFWGTASDGQAWGADAATNSAFTIASNKGVMATLSASLTGVLGPTLADTEVLLSGQATSFVNTNFGGVLRWQSSTNWYKGYIDGTSLIISVDFSGTVTNLATVSFTPSVSTDYYIRFRIVGYTLSAKIWAVGAAEPAAWTASATDPNSRFATGQAGIRGVTNSTTISADAITVYDLSAKVVAASQLANVGNGATTSTRTASEQAALSAPGLTRSASSLAAISSLGLTRSASEQATVSNPGLHRSASESAAVSAPGLQRSASETAAISAPGITRSAGEQAALSTLGLARTASEQAAILATSTRSTSGQANISAPALTRAAILMATLSAPGLQRSATETAAILATSTRSAGEQAALSAPNLARLASQATTLSGGSVRTASLLATLSAPGLQRSASEQAALQTTSTRTASEAASLSTPGLVRSASESATLSTSNLARSASQAASLSGQGVSRTASSLATLSAPGLTRTAGETARLSAPGLARSASESAALQSTASRAASESAALSSILTRSASEAAALSTPGLTRRAALLATLASPGLTRIAASSAALLRTSTRTASEQVALAATMARSASESAALAALGLARTAQQTADITVINVGSGGSLQLPLLTALVETGRRGVSLIQTGERDTSSDNGRKYTG